MERESSWIGAQKKVFTRWANTHLSQRGLKISDIDNDLRNGTILITLIEILSGKSADSFGHKVSVPHDGKIQKLTNAARALKFIESQGINLVNCRPEHLVDNNAKMVLGLLWRVITKYHIQAHLTEEELVHESGNSGTLSRSQKLGHFLNKTTRDALLRWCRTELEVYNLSLANFTKSFQNTAVLAALVHKQDPSLISLDEIANMEPSAAYAQIFSVAETGLHIPQLFSACDLLEGAADECSVMTYVAYFLNHKRGSEQKTTVASPDVAAVEEAQPAVGPHHNEDLDVENARLRKENESLKEYIKKEIESIYLAVENNVRDTTQSCDSKLNSVVRKMLKLELTINKLTDLAKESAKHASELEAAKEHDHDAADIEREEFNKEKDALVEERGELAKEREEISREREEMARLKAELSAEREQINKDKELIQLEREVLLRKKKDRKEEKKRDRKNRATVGLPAEEDEPKSIHIHADDGDMYISAELNISSEDLSKAEMALNSPIAPLSPEEGRSSTPTELLQELSKELVQELSQPPQAPEEKPQPQLDQQPQEPQEQNKSTETSTEPPEQQSDDNLDPKKLARAQSMARRWLARRRYKIVKRRREIAMEILNTERHYINCLQMMTQEYFQPLREMAKDRNGALSHTLNDNMLKTIFSNIEVILNINSILLKKLQQRGDAWHVEQKIGDVFLSMMEFLKCYNQYVNHYNKSIDTLAECAKSPAFLDFIRIKSLKCGRELRDLLIVPIQRIPRYVILLEELCKYTHRDHPDAADLASALSKMQNIADYVNEKKRDYEALAQVSAVQEMLVGISILEYTRLRYLAEGDLSIISEDGKKTVQCHVFLFNEMLICCKQVKKVFGDRKQKQPKYKFKSMLTFTVDSRVEVKSDNMFVVELSSSDVYRFLTKNQDRDMWVQHIKSSIEKMVEGKRMKVDRASRTLG